MGIPVYFSHIIKKYKFILKKIHHNTNFDVFFFDANSIIYDIYNDILKNNNNNIINNNDLENEIIKKSIDKINKIINIFKINKEVVICFDGVAPLSKLKQQRERRFKSYISKKILKNKDLWNTCNITPGTNFMDKLSLELKKYNNNFYKINKDRKEKIVILDSNVNGEGEQKIFNYLKNNYKIKDYSNENEKNNLNICIYGLDSDLIMLSLLHSNYYTNIRLFRETPEFIKNLNKNLNPDENYLLNITQLSTCLCRSLYNPEIIQKNIRNLNKLIFKTNINYILLFFLVGNDFVPHSQSLSLRLNGAEILTDLYEKLLQDNDLFYIKEKKIFINWKSIKMILKELGTIEYENMNNYHEYKCEIQTKVKKNDKIMNNKNEILNYIPLFNVEEEEYILSNEKFYKERYYELTFGTDYNKKDICYQYLKNIEWNLLYYLGDERCNLNYYYPYYHAPFFSDLVDYVPSSFESLYDKNNIKNEYIHPLTQILYIFPSNYYNLIKTDYLKDIKKIKNNDTYNILFNDPEELIIDIDHNFVKYFFESSIHFKQFNILSLDEEIKK